MIKTMHTISVILNDNLYQKLKAIVPNRKISKFVAEAVNEKLSQKSAALHKAYMEAYKDKDRNKECKLWDDISGEDWK